MEGRTVSNQCQRRHHQSCQRDCRSRLLPERAANPTSGCRAFGGIQIEPMAGLWRVQLYRCDLSIRRRHRLAEQSARRRQWKRARRAGQPHPRYSATSIQGGCGISGHAGVEGRRRYGRGGIAILRWRRRQSEPEIARVCRGQSAHVVSAQREHHAVRERQQPVQQQVCVVRHLFPTGGDQQGRAPHHADRSAHGGSRPAVRNLWRASDENLIGAGLAGSVTATERMSGGGEKRGGSPRPTARAERCAGLPG